MISYSQLGEDIYVFQNLINVPRRDIVLFEIGAFDGVKYSNSLMLETLFQCKAVLVEPSPMNFQKVCEQRKAASKHRVAVAENFGVSQFAGDHAVSGLTAMMTDDYIKQHGIDAKEIHTVITCTLDAIIAVEKVAYIDFMSIDIQGGEYSALLSMNWDIPVGTICIEMEGHDEARNDLCRALLTRQGFVFAERLVISEFWVNPNYHRANAIFDKTKVVGLSGFETRYLQDNHKAKIANKLLL